MKREKLTRMAGAVCLIISSRKKDKCLNSPGKWEPGFWLVNQELHYKGINGVWCLVTAHSYRCGVTEWKTRFVCYTQALNFGVGQLFKLSLFNLQQCLEWHPRLHPFSVGSAAYEGLALIFNKPRVCLQKDEAYRESSHCPRGRRYIWWGSSVLVVQGTYANWPSSKPDTSYFLLFLVVFSSRFFLTASGVSKAIGEKKKTYMPWQFLNICQWSLASEIC